MRFLANMNIDHLTQLVFWLDGITNPDGLLQYWFTFFAFLIMIVLNVRWKYGLQRISEKLG